MEIIFGITAKTIFTAKLINYAIALSMFRHENFVLFSGENINITVSPNFDFSEVQIRENNKSIDYKIENNKIVISTKARYTKKVFIFDKY